MIEVRQGPVVQFFEILELHMVVQLDSQCLQVEMGLLCLERETLVKHGLLVSHSAVPQAVMLDPHERVQQRIAEQVEDAPQSLEETIEVAKSGLESFTTEFDMTVSSDKSRPPAIPISQCPW